MEVNSNSLPFCRHTLPDGNLWIVEQNNLIFYGSSKDECKAKVAANDFAGYEGYPYAYPIPGTVNPTFNKTPMLVVGSNNYIRNHAPHFLIQNYDIYLYFEPSAQEYWTVGIIAIHRTKAWLMRSVFSIDKNIQNAIARSIAQLVGTAEEIPHDTSLDTKLNHQLMLWMMHWIYRLPKISLKDILHLEDYK